jgi:predicted regulator of Ras-like GTPase activity (Roadblock/LC7/MglB family)
MLQDVDGVHGSFVVAESGSLVDRDLPAAFDEALFAEVGPRIARLFETFVSGGKDLETCVLRYAEHKLYVRKMTWGIMAVLSSAGINLAALRMVTNLVVRRIDPEIAPLLSKHPSSSTLPKVPTSPVPVKAAMASQPLSTPGIAVSGAWYPWTGGTPHPSRAIGTCTCTAAAPCEERRTRSTPLVATLRRVHQRGGRSMIRARDVGFVQEAHDLPLLVRHEELAHPLL